LRPRSSGNCLYPFLNRKPLRKKRLEVEMEATNEKLFLKFRLMCHVVVVVDCIRVKKSIENFEV
jgi:hypothetical protein